MGYAVSMYFKQDYCSKDFCYTDFFIPMLNRLFFNLFKLWRSSLNQNTRLNVSLYNGRINIWNYSKKASTSILSQGPSYLQTRQRTFWRHIGIVLAILCFIDHSCYKICLKMLTMPKLCQPKRCLSQFCSKVTLKQGRVSLTSEIALY